MIGGCGFWTGFGQVIIGSKFTNSPWYSAFDLVQISFMASIRSRASLWRLAKAVPWLAISSSFQPLPIPNRKRPPEIWSIEATCLAVWIGSRWAIRQMPVPSSSVLVTAAAAPSTTNGSITS